MGRKFVFSNEHELTLLLICLTPEIKVREYHLDDYRTGKVSGEGISISHGQGIISCIPTTKPYGYLGINPNGHEILGL